MSKQNLLSKLLLLVAVMLAGAGTAWADKITDYNDIVSGKKYYIGATVSNTDYYFYADGSVAATGVQGTSKTDKNDAAVLVFEGSGDQWTVKFDNSDYYLSLAKTKNNGKVDVVEEAATWTLSNTAKDLIQMKVNEFVLQKNSSTSLNFGSYASGQTDVWLELAESFSITAVSNNDSWGTVTLSGSIITATPAAGYTYADPAYTVTEGTATVVQNGNSFAVTPTSACTVQINFAAIPTYTVTLGDDNTMLTEAFGNAGVTLPTRSDIGDYAFAGWSETNIASETTTAPTIIPAGVYMPVANITLYPVYTKTEGSGIQNKTASVIIADYASANNWENGKAYQPLVMDENISVGGTISGNNFKYYSSDNSWRFYTGGSFTVTANNGATLSSVTLTFGDGSLSYGEESITSGTAFDVTGTSAVISAGGTTKITVISVDYAISSGTVYYWSSPVAAAVERPVITVAENPFFFSTTATITCATEGAAIKYSFDGTTWSDYSAALTINETKTIYAKAIKGSDESSVAQVTATKNLAEPTVTIDATGITNTNVFEGTAAGSLAATVTYNDAAIEGATVTWSGNNDDVATIDATTGAVTLVGAGSVTFTATFAGNADYSEKPATYEMTVTNIDPNANDGSKDKPYTVAEAIAFIETLGSATSTDDVYVSGIISQVDEYNSKYSSITYWISDDGKTTTQMEVYSGKGFDGANFSSKDDLQVGDIVTVKGKVKMYNSTPEFVQNNQLVSFNRPVVASITVSPTTVDATAAETDGTLTVTYNNLTNYLSEVQFVASDGETSATYDWLDAEINTTDDTMLDYTIGENTTTEVRKAYMKVYAVGDEGEAYSNLITITQAAPVIMNTYTLATSITSGKHYVIASGTDEAVKVMGGQNNNNRAAVNGIVSGTTLSIASDADVTEVIIYGPDASGLYSIYDKDNGYLYAASSSSNYLKSQAINDVNGKWEIAFGEGEVSIVAKNSGNRNVMQYNSGSTLFSCYASASQKPVYLFEKYGDVAQTSTVDVKLNAYGFATYASTGVLDFLDAADASFSAWQITGVSTENKITFEQIESTVATGTGIMLKGKANATITLNVMPGTGAKLSDNKLVGITEPTTIATGEYYGLSGNNFVKVGAGEAPANKALLPAELVNESNSARFTFVFEGETTGIATVKSVQLNETVYNLRGQRVDNPVKGGLYIVGGKKVIMK